MVHRSERPRGPTNFPPAATIKNPYTIVTAAEELESIYHSTSTKDENAMELSQEVCVTECVVHMGNSME